MNRRRYLVAYDICDPKRLRKVFKTMNDFGEPLQYSVFRCDLSAKERQLLISALDEIIHHSEDQILLAGLGPARPGPDEDFTFLGRTTPPPSRDPVVI
ncbi:MAG: CRISPR-associated endonuclease Cas2 [Planctomycetota bacterium]